jgi:transcriptional regulator
MKEWIVIHQIKALHNKGNGLSERKIAKQLSISRNTVSKYLNLSEPDITAELSDTERTKKLDEYRDYIIQLLQTYPELSAVKVLHKLKAKIETLRESANNNSPIARVNSYIPFTQCFRSLNSFFVNFHLFWQ